MEDMVLLYSVIKFAVVLFPDIELLCVSKKARIYTNMVSIFFSYVYKGLVNGA